MCLVGVGKWMEAVFSEIGSAGWVLGAKALGGLQKGPFFRVAQKAKMIATILPGQCAGYLPGAWGSKCRPRRAKNGLPGAWGS